MQHPELTPSLFRDVLDAAPDAMVIADSSGKIMLVNAQAEKLFGHGRDELLGQPIEKLMPERYRGRHTAHRDGYIAAPRVRPMGAGNVLFGLHRDGHEFPIEISLSPIKTSLGTLVCSAIRDISERRKADEDRALAAAIVAHSADAVVAKKLDGTVLSWNKGAENLFGYTAQEMIGQNIRRLFPRERLDEEEHFIGQIVAGDMVDHFETKRIHKDGSDVDISVTLSPIRDERGSIFAVSKVARDNRAQRRRQDEALALAVVENSDDAIYSSSAHGTVLTWNRGAEKLYGYTRAEMIGAPVARICTQDRQHEAAFFVREIEGGRDVSLYRSRHASKAGSVIDVSLTVSPIRDARGRLVGLSTIGRDITERVRLQDEAQRAGADLEQIVRHAPMMIGLWNPDYTLCFANDGYAALYGLTTESMRGKHVAEVLGPDAYALAKPRIDSAVAGAAQAFEREYRAHDGSVQYHLIHYVPDRRPAGGNGLFVFVTDITRRKIAEKRAAEAADGFRRLYERTPAMLHSIDRHGTLLSVSDTWLARLGYRRDEVLGRSIAEFLTPESRARAEEVNIPLTFRQGWIADCEEQMIRKDGTVIDVLLSAFLEPESQGRLDRTFAVIQDVTARKRAESELKSQHELMKVTLDSIGDAVITTDEQGAIKWLNPVAERLTGWLLHEAQGRPLDQIFHILHEDTRRPAPSPIAGAIAPKRGDPPEHTLLISRDGLERSIEDSVAPIRGESGTVLGTVVVFHDVTEQRRLAREVTHRASHDVMTGLINRAEFETRLKRSFTSARIDGATHVLMYIDLDQFKLVNDACGHAAGDRLLREVADIFRNTVRSRDTLARLGGDEFGVILEHCQIVQAWRIAEQVCEQMENYRFLHGGRRFRVGASIGVVPLDARWSTEAEILQAADASCYAAKEAGRNRVHEWFDSDATVRSRQSEMSWVARIEKAFEERRFRLYAQRIEPCAAPAEAVSLELLLRLVEGDGSIVLPGAFLPAAERFNLASRIDRWVLLEAVKWIEANAASRVQVLSINLSAHSVGDRAFHQFAAEIARQVPFSPGRLCFEITETAAITHLAEARAFVEEMHRCGVKVALDDFGAGASSFSYLRTLPIDFLKIDGQYVRSLLADSLDRTAVRCFRDVAAICGIQTVAEGIESEEVLDELRRLKIDYAQGLLLHTPEPLENFSMAADSTSANGRET